MSRQLLEDVQIAIGDEAEVAVRDGVIVVVPRKRLRGRHNLRELVGRIPGDYETEEPDWGPPAGKEDW